MEQELDEIEAMFVQTAVEASAEGSVLTLHDVGAATLYFSDRPKRVVGHVTSDMFVDMWDEGENSFREDPPNAVLAFLESGEDLPEDVVIEIQNPRIEGSRLMYDFKTLDGAMPASAKGGVTLFIDPFGRPAVAGVSCRHASPGQAQGSAPHLIRGRAPDGVLSEDAPERVQERGNMSERMPSGAAVGWISFAGILMVVVGGFKILQGLGWVINSKQLLP